MTDIDALCAQYDGLMKMDGFDDCVAGVVVRYGMPAVLCYHHKKVIASLMGQGMTWDEAVEYFEFNQIGAYVGDQTPCFLMK